MASERLLPNADLKITNWIDEAAGDGVIWNSINENPVGTTKFSRHSGTTTDVLSLGFANPSVVTSPKRAVVYVYWTRYTGSSDPYMTIKLGEGTSDPVTIRATNTRILKAKGGASVIYEVAFRRGIELTESAWDAINWNNIAVECHATVVSSSKGQIQDLYLDIDDDWTFTDPSERTYPNEDVQTTNITASAGTHRSCVDEDPASISDYIYHATIGDDEYIFGVYDYKKLKNLSKITLTSYMQIKSPDNGNTPKIDQVKFGHGQVSSPTFDVTKSVSWTVTNTTQVSYSVSIERGVDLTNAAWDAIDWHDLVISVRLVSDPFDAGGSFDYVQINALHVDLVALDKAITPSSIDPAGGVGSPNVLHIVAPSSIDPAGGLGSPSLARFSHILYLASIDPAGGVGEPVISLTGGIYPSSINPAGGVGSPSLTRGVGAVTVDVSESFGALESLSASQVEGGENHAVLGNEIISFRTAELAAAFQYGLSNLDRTLRETPGNGHAIGDLFCLITEDVARIAVPESVVGQVVKVKCVSKYQSLSDVDSHDVTIAPASPSDIFVPDDIFVRVDPFDVVFDTGNLTTGVNNVWSAWQAIDFSGSVPVGASAVLVNWSMNVFTGSDQEEEYLAMEFRRSASYTADKFTEYSGGPKLQTFGLSLSGHAILPVGSDLSGEIRYLQNNLNGYSYVMRVVAYFKKP